MTSTSMTAPFDDRTLERLAPLLTKLELDFEIAVFEIVLVHAPDDLQALEALGMAYTQRGLFEKGLRVDRRLAELKPGNARVHYNLACSYSLVGDIDLSIASLERAIELGYDDLEHLERDRDLDPVRQHPRFSELVKKIPSPDRSRDASE
jgi:tetratricopeptide (TPR) repeat protein